MTIEQYLTTQLKENEEILAVVRKHGAVIVPPVGLGTLLLLADFFLMAWWFNHAPWGTAGFFVVFLVAAVIIGRALYLWRYNVFAVTTKRVIEIDQRGFFERHVTEATLDKIQDVRYVIKGLWATIFSFGTVRVQTAGNAADIDAECIHHPVDLQRLITDTQQKTAPVAASTTTQTNILDVRRLTREP